MSIKRHILSLVLVVTSLGLARPASAASVPPTLSLGGELFNPDGSLVKQTSVNFRIQIYDAAETCVLYSEEHLAENLVSTGGRFNLLLGSGTSIVNNVSGATALDTAVFNNTGTTTVTNCGPVALNPGDARQVHVLYDLGTGFTAMTPAVPVVASAYALVAETLGGHPAADFIQVNGTSALNQANEEYAFSVTNWPRLKALLDGTSSQYLPSSPTVPLDVNGQKITDLADPTAAQDAATKHYVDTNLGGSALDLTAVGPMTGAGSTLLWDATANKWVAGTLSTSPTGAAGGDLTGTYPNPSIANDVITAAKIKSAGVAVNRLIITDATTGASLGYGECTANGQVFAWTATGWACTSVSTLAPVTSVAGKTGAVILNAADVGGLGTAALFDWGTAAGQIVRLDGTAKLPAVDGSQLLNVNAVALQGRAIASVAPAVGQVLGWNGSAWAPVGAAAGSVTSVAGGTGLLGGPITSTGTLSVDVGTTANKILQLNSSAQVPAVDGSLLTQVNAVSLQSRAVAGTAPSAGQVLGWNASATRWEPVSAALGSVTSIATTGGLLGGTITGVGTLSVDTGTSANKILQLTASAQVPAVDGSLLTGVNAVQLQSRNVAATNPTAGQVLSWNASTTQWEPTNGAAGNVTSFATGTGLLGGPITTSGTISVDVGTAGNKIVQENANAQIAQSAGTVALPSYTFVGSTNTGLYSPGANQVALVTNGAAALNIQSSGYVGIGTNAAKALLNVSLGGTLSSAFNAGTGEAFVVSKNSGAGDYVQMFLIGGNNGRETINFGPDGARYSGAINYDNSTQSMQFMNSGERVRITSAGSVGIGSTVPTAALDVNVVGTTSAIVVPRDTTGNRPSGVNGMLRYNTSNNVFEGFANGLWSTIAAGSAAGTITNIASGTGLLGGPITTMGTLSVDVGTAANKVVQENANAQIAQSAGTVALPSYAFAGNTNTGLYSPGPNQLALVANGSAALTVASSGNIGIGSAAPSFSLDVKSSALNSTIALSSSAWGTGSTATLYLGDTASYVQNTFNGSFIIRGNAPMVLDPSVNDFTIGSTPRVIVKGASGFVGVGTASPLAIMDIYAVGTAGSGLIIPRDTTANRPGGVNGMLRYNTSNNVFEGFANGLWSTIAAGSAAGTITNIASGTGLLGGPITTSGTLSVDVGTAANKIVQENASAQIAQSIGSASLPTYSFAGNVNTGFYSPGANQVALVTNGTAALNVTAGGSVGIGTSSPGATLHVMAPTSSSPGVIAVQGTSLPTFASGTIAGFSGNVSNATYVTRVGILGGATGAANLEFGNYTNQGVGSIIYNNSTNAMLFATNSGTRVTISSAGSVGIGTSSPAAALDINVVGSTSALIVPRDIAGNRPTGVNGMLRYNTSNNVFEGFANGLWSTIAAGSAAGTITNITGGTGLLGGPITTSGTLSVDVGTAANKIVQENANAQIAQSAGSASLPSYSFAANTTTGIFSPAANQLALVTNGSAALSVLASGNVGVGTAAPGTKFEVAGDARASGTVYGTMLNTSNGIQFGDATMGVYTGNSGATGYLSTIVNNLEKMRITAAGNMGIGTQSPMAGLDVATIGTAGSAIIVPRDTTANRPGGVNGMLRYNTSNNAFEGFANGLWSTIAAGSAAGTITNIATGTGLLGGPITTTGTLSVDVGTAANKVVQENANAQIAQSNGSVGLPSYSFNGSPATGLYSPGTNQVALVSNGTAALTVAANGYVGIGTGSPQYPLDVSGVAFVGGPVNNLDQNQAAHADLTKLAFSGKMLFGYNYSGGAGETDFIGNRQFGSSGGFRFYDYSNGNVMTPLMNITGDGRLGLGTLTPLAALDVTATGSASAILIPRDTTANRPGGVNGMLRYNTTSNGFEGFANGVWATIASGSSAGSVTNIATGTGLLGGPITTMGTLSVDVGTAANKIVQENANAQIAQATGSVSLPSYSFNGNLNTGVFSPGANQVSLVANGTAALNVSASGNVGIGTSLAFAPLTVVGAGDFTSTVNSQAGGFTTYNASAGAPSFRNATGGAGVFFPSATSLAFATNGNERMRIDAFGNVAIGGTAPQAILDLASNGTNSALIVPRDTTTNRPGGVNGMIRYNTDTAAFEGFANGVWGGLAGAGATGPWATNGGNVYYGTGSVGINTATPGAALDVNGEFRVTGASNPTSGVGVEMQYYSGQGKVFAYDRGATAARPLMVQGSTLSLFGNNNTGATIDALGNLGVGTTTPAAALDVATTGSNSAIVVPRDTAANRPTPVNGMIRYNTDAQAMEAYVNGAWMQITVQPTGSVQPVNASGPPVNAGIYAISSASANYTPGFGSVANTYNGNWPASGAPGNSNPNCVQLDTQVVSSNAIIYDLGVNRTIGHVYIAAEGAPYGYMIPSISFSTDGTTFNSSFTTQTAQDPYVYFIAPALSPSVTARYVRVTNSGSNGDNNSTSHANAVFCQIAFGP